MATFKNEPVPGGVVRRRERPHDCTPPNIAGANLRPGDEFVCGACGAEHVVEDDQREGMYWSRKRTHG